MPEQDILVTIPDEDLPELYKMYQKNNYWLPYVQGAFENGIAWKKEQPGDNSMLFMSPNNCWREDGTFIVLTRIHCYELFMCTLDDKCENLYKGLKETKRIDFTQPRILLYCTHEKHFPTVEKIMREKNVEVIDSKPVDLFILDVEEAKKFTVSVPPGVELRPLTPQDAPLMDSLWALSWPGSLQYVSTYITRNGGLGLYLPGTQQLVSSIVKGTMTHLRVLLTLDKYRKRGYAEVLTKLMCKRLGEEGIYPLATVWTKNPPSQGLFRKLGFKSIGIGHYTVVGFKGGR